MPGLADDLPPCVGCAACCRLVVELTPGVDVIAEALVVRRDGALFMDQESDGTCVALDRQTRRCTIYEGRPETCRRFERGGGRCREVLFGRP